MNVDYTQFGLTVAAVVVGLFAYGMIQEYRNKKKDAED
jgi:hypothetical protein